MDLVIALDIGGTKIAGGLVTPDGQIITHSQVETKAFCGGEAVMTTATAFARLLADDALKRGSPAAAIGVGSTGQLDPVTGTVRSATHSMPGWAGIPVKDRLEKALGLPAWVENDAQVMALGEALYGAGKDKAIVLGMTVGTGIGGGIIINGKIFHGSQGYAGHFGHMTINARGRRLCPCSRRGCVEVYASAPAIIKDFVRQMNQVKLEKMGILDLDGLDVKQITSLAKQGHPEALTAIQRGAAFLGIAVGSLLNVFNPDVIIIGGGVAQIGTMYLESVQKEARQHVLALMADTPIELARLGTLANITGAAHLAWSNL